MSNLVVLSTSAPVRLTSVPLQIMADPDFLSDHLEGKVHGPFVFDWHCV